ncbi:MAG: TonB-dependent receptor [Runella sp.]
MSIKRYLYAIVFCWTTTCIAQSPTACRCFVKGVVTDRETQKPIAGAILKLQGYQQVAITDAEGHYKIENLCEGTYTLECRIVGYKAVQTQISLYHSAEENLNLSEEEIHLQDIDIVARRLPASFSQKSVLIDGQTLTQSQGQTLGDVLKNIAGVTTLQTGYSIAKPVINGLHSNRVLILNNGIRQEGQQWGSEHAPEIDPFVAKRVMVVKGVAGVRYGSDAIGGVVLIEPEPLPVQQPISGEVNLLGFSNGRMAVGSALLQGGVRGYQGWGWRVQGTVRNGGNIRTPDYFLANTGLREQNFSAAGGYKDTRKGIELYYSHFQTYLGIFSGAHIGSTTDLLQVIQQGEPLIKVDFHRNIERPRQDINHNLLKIKAFYNFNGNHLNLTFGRQYNQRAEYDLHGPQADTRAALLFRLTTLTSDLIFEHKPIAKKLNGQWGVSGLYQYNFTDGRPLIPDFEQSNLGVFIIEKLHHKKWSWEVGARYDWRFVEVFRFIGRTLSPRQHTFGQASGMMGAIYTPNERWTFRANAGTAWRPPNINELYSRGVHHGAAAFEEGNDQLAPETAYNLTASADFSGKRLVASLGVFHNTIDNYIYLKPQNQPILTIRGAFPYFKYTQTRATFTGFDLTSTYHLTPHLQYSHKLSCLWAYDQQAQDYLVLIPANRTENGLKYLLNPLAKFQDNFISINHLWVDRQRRVPPNSDFMPPPPAYHLWSVAVGGKYLLSEKKNVEWSIGVQNLFDNAYRDYLNRFRYFALEQGRNISIKTKWSF